MEKVKTFRQFLDEGKTIEGLSIELQAASIQQVLLAMKENIKAVCGNDSCDVLLDKAVNIIEKIKKTCCKQEKANGTVSATTTHEEAETEEHEAGESQEFEAGEQEESGEIEGVVVGEEEEEEEGAGLGKLG